MRILFVSRYFHPDTRSSSQLLADLAFELAGQKHDVTVLTSARTHDAAAALPPRESIMDVKVMRLEGTSGGMTGLPGLATEVLSLHRAFYQALAETVREGDLVVTLSDPPMLGTVCERIVRKQNARLINWLDELFPEITKASEKPIPGAVAKLLQRARKHALQHSSLTVVPTESMARRLEETGAPQGTVHALSPWGLATVDAPTPRSGASLREAWGLQDRLVVGYVGELQRLHDRESLLSGIEQTARMADKGLTWLFVGGGGEMAELRAAVPMRAMDMVQFQDALPMRRMAEGLAVPDVHVVSLLPALDGAAFPGNLPAVLASGKPLIYVGEKHGEIGSMIEGEGCGMAVQGGDAEGLSAAIAQLHAIPDSREDMGRRARALYEKRFARRKALDAWMERLAGVGRG